MLRNITLPQDHPWGSRIRYYDTLGSTNTLAKELAAQGAPEGTVVLAGSQTGGRGRMGRSFHSPEAVGLYLSVILRPGCAAARLMHLTCAVGVAVCDGVEAALGLRPRLKWANDLVWGQRKLGGILTELGLHADGRVDYAVVGIGINCCQKEGQFPADIEVLATSLSLAAGQDIDRAKVAAGVITALEKLAGSLFSPDWMERYQADCVTLGQDISLVRGDGIRHGKALCVEADGALTVRFPDGHTEQVASGEVSIRGMYGYI